MECLENHRVNNVPSTIYYIPDFITQENERYLESQVYGVAKTKWTNLSQRRLQNWGGHPHPKGMILEALPLWLKECSDMLQTFKPFGPNQANHVLVNEYKPGQGIMPHTDGPLYFPTVATISLGCQTVLDFYKPNNTSQTCGNQYQFSLLLERRSLILLRENMYTDFLHGIDDNTTDFFENKCIKNKHLLGNAAWSESLNDPTFALPRTSTRVSLTIRFVPKTLKLKWKT
uniref:Alpha-ketoglutarate-dependent dioxygenase alkB homolog 6-like n=1 Tax=Phallusia mammillata TaxID=59560 RepID=A0A6F9D5J5_9ASCI|nr:alpha-ketoglutarate-dependent dioxygenase alkB homolog 6-like [Phallusia mammillata]